MTSETTAELTGIHRRQKRRTWLTVGLTLVVFLLLAFGGCQFVSRANEEEQRAEQAVGAADQLCAQVRALGGFCVVDPAQLRGQEGPTGPAGPAGPGPTDEQVAAAVAAYFAANPPAPGRAPTTGEIAEAVADYLAANPLAPGEQGPGPTREQILAAVTEYLIANPPPAGPAGPEGPVGPAGEPGQDGQDGADGADGATGPAGPAGAPGPACPDGWHPEERTVLAPPETWIVCVQDQEG